jgi:peptide deformylase
MRYLTRNTFLKVNGEEVDVESIMPLIFINPEITCGQQKDMATEGCLSIKGIPGGRCR